eukprot:IDg16262t1
MQYCRPTAFDDYGGASLRGVAAVNGQRGAAAFLRTSGRAGESCSRNAGVATQRSTIVDRLETHTSGRTRIRIDNTAPRHSKRRVAEPGNQWHTSLHTPHLNMRNTTCSPSRARSGNCSFSRHRSAPVDTARA